MNKVETDQLSDELLDTEIPCGGIIFKPIARTCSNAAVLRSFGHGCHPVPSAPCKCITCWQIWYTFHVDMLRKQGFIRCYDCRCDFLTVEAFSDYRAF